MLKKDDKSKNNKNGVILCSYTPNNQYGRNKRDNDGLILFIWQQMNDTQGENAVISFDNNDEIKSLPKEYAD